MCRWQVLKVEGTVVHLAHHRSSGCIAFITLVSSDSFLTPSHDMHGFIDENLTEVSQNLFPLLALGRRFIKPSYCTRGVHATGEGQRALY